jgi:tripartite-type tricarboxylate transporter receptor subunit TctC
VDGLPSLVQHLKSDTVRALAVTSKERLPGFPDIPTVTETYPAYEPIIGWFAIFVPKGTPVSIQERINRDVNTIMQNADVIARLNELGIYPKTGDIASARSFVENQRTLMKNVVTELGLQAR